MSNAIPPLVRIEVHCHVCGVTISPTAKACSRHRHAANRNKRQRACPQCGTTFMPYPSAVLRGSGKYCSRECWRLAVAPRHALIPVTCDQCGRPFRRTRAAVARVTHSFCGSACSVAFRHGPSHPAWRGGEAHWRGRTWTVALREQIRERDGRRCRMCGKPESENRAKRLEVDHVIPFRWFDGDFERANQPDNLVALCKSCHGRKSRAEAKFLRGDVIEMNRYRQAVALPWPEVPQMALGLAS